MNVYSDHTLVVYTDHDPSFFFFYKYEELVKNYCHSCLRNAVKSELNDSATTHCSFSFLPFFVNFARN